ncbi:MAG: hypothetical protein D6775_16975 [Caldilineae bacterium]|nr:MAG: hypothetical protein D6775_16975 [Caldilineae bacterium]
MPARATRTYLVLGNATDRGLCFPCPLCWDLERLAQQYRERSLKLPAGDEVLFLASGHVLCWDREKGQWDECVPRNELECTEDAAAREARIRRLQTAKWLIVHRGQVWLVPDEAGEAAAVVEGPLWWQITDEVRRAFVERFADRFVDESNPLWSDYVHVLTGEEARAFDELAQRLTREYVERAGSARYWYREVRPRMKRLAEVLERAVWVVVYTYEWESGLA